MSCFDVAPEPTHPTSPPEFTERNGRISEADAVHITDITEGIESGVAVLAVPVRHGEPGHSDRGTVNVPGYGPEQFGGWPAFGRKACAENLSVPGAILKRRRLDRLDDPGLRGAPPFPSPPPAFI